MNYDEWGFQGMMGAGDGPWYWFTGLHGIISLVSLAIIVFVLVALARDWRRDRHLHFALDDLTTRYTSGSIGRDEYLAKIRDLSG